MTQRGGARSGAGRKHGGRNKLTVERELLAEHGMATAHRTGLMPLDILLARMRDEPLPNGQKPTDAQVAAAVAAAPFLHPKLAAVAVREVTPPRQQVDLSRLSLDEKKLILNMLNRVLIAQPSIIGTDSD